MKKIILLLAPILISTLGFSQNKIGGNDPITGIDIIIKEDPGSQRTVNAENNPLITEINKLEFEYLNMKAREIQYGFANQDVSKLKTKNEVLKAYIAYIQKAIKSDKQLMKKKYGDGDLLKHFSIPRAKFKNTGATKLEHKKVDAHKKKQ
ncbi:hypothetical protein CW731_08980 [Polaribacter sp. ALD11]|uniref:hypothetical protein n=1 Tax=Polaribacter sp. ALD11 TaxID=2058137 RepID=UPI000C305AD4|nr:hypothetical protein [Polaribacter sp. ALD11]AUC85413.1 hypothetical protein CW731_08980 [Polaribacter sp. ALD11]